uniref:Uncharacterized protein n=1 Tax=Panagrolaimus sp. ES5 TaxID=591445 RepID=A0AC34FTW8_9BILA
MILSCGLLSSANITTKEKETISIVMISKDDIYVTQLQNTENGYSMIAEELEIIDFKDCVENNQAKIYLFIYEIGEKPKKLGFWIFEDKYSKEESERIKA